MGQHLTVQPGTLIRPEHAHQDHSPLFLAPAILTFKLNAPQSPESELARQFNEDPVINYGIWGFIAGLTDYFVRNGFTTTTTTTAATTTTTTTTAAPATRRTASKVNFRKKQQDKKQKQEKKEKKEKKRLEREEKKQKKKAVEA